MSKVTIFGTPLRIRPVVLVNLGMLWAVAAFLEHFWHPHWTLGLILAVGFGAVILLLLADFGHAAAHIFSARRSGGPMDELYISGGMPRTRYFNNDVPPEVHIGRSLGGPIFNLAGTLVSLAVLLLATNGSVMADLAGWSLTGQALILAGSLLPLPVVDGGVLLKWWLVRGGRTEAEAERFVKRAGWVSGIVIALVVVGVIAFRRGWLG